MSGSLVVSTLVGATLAMALVLAAVRVTRHSRAALRHVLLAAAFAMIALLPVAVVVVPSISVPVPIASAYASTPAVDLIAEVVTPNGPDAALPGAPVSAPPRSAMPSVAAILGALWLAGAVVFLLPVAVGLRQIRALRASALPWLRGEAKAAQWSRELEIRRRVDVLMHERVAGPMTSGLMRPVVVFPVDAATWSEEELDRAVVHELEHVRRRDWMSQCLARVICAGYWFHPLVWIARRRFELEAERACDDAVLLRAEALGYADQLVGLAARLSAGHRHPLLAMASRRDLPTRVRALLDVQQARGRAGAVTVAGASVVAVVLVLAMSPLRIVMRAQTGPDGRFDAAAVHLHPFDGGAKREFRTTYGPQNIDFRGLAIGVVIGEAFGVPTARIVGATTQVTNVLHAGVAYDIEARAARPASRDELRGMLRSLLADQFKLQEHRESRNAQVYRLLPASGGPKLTPSQPGDYESSGAPDGFVYRHAEVARLTSLLSSFVGREVVDETGLKGIYDFTLQLPDGFTPASAKAGIGSGTAPDAASFAASLRALGLRLEAGTASIDYVIVDRVEPPTEPTAASPRFEAVSIRPCQDDTPLPAASGQRSSQGGFPTVSPGHFAIDCGTVERLISNAYVLNGERLENNGARIGDVSWWKGGPEWIRYDKFTIEASAPGVSDQAVLLGPMLRALLEDRFQLRVRRELQDAPMYEMTIAKGGLKIQPMPPDGCVAYSSNPNEAAFMRSNADAVIAGTAKPTCDSMTMMGAPGRSQWTIGGTTLSNFAGTLTAQMDHYVINKTGYDPETKFNVHLEFAPDEHVPGADKRNPRTTFAPPDAPTIFNALEQQLGLKLTAAKGAQGVLVIDHVEHPKADGGWVVPMRARGAGR
jgi:uncharacterized protein (TIGR03435 family)